MNSFYKPSGAFSPVSFIYFLLVALIAFPIMGFVYAYGIWYIPFPYLNIIFCGVFGLGVGLLLDYVVTLGKVRNPNLAIAFGVLGGIIALYFHWAIWLDLVINAGNQVGTSAIGITVSSTKFTQIFGLITHPNIMLEVMGLVYDSGTWGIGGAAVSGIFLGIIWFIELAVLIALPVFQAKTAAEKPYDESSNAWMHQAALPISMYIDNPETVLSNVMAGNYTDLYALQFGGSGVHPEGHHSVLTLFHADTTDYFLSITNNIATLDDKGKTSLSGTEFMQYLSISKAAGDMLLGKTNHA